MTDKEMALKIVKLVHHLQARNIACETLLSRYRLELHGRPISWKHEVDLATEEALSRSGPYGQNAEQLERDFSLSTPDSLLGTLYRGLFPL
jgi:hypothetical protein